MRLIDAEGSELQTQLKIIREAEYQIYGSGSWGFTAKCEHAIEDAHTIQPKRGTWVYQNGMFKCDQCLRAIRRIDHDGLLNFCPNCGADMREETT